MLTKESLAWLQIYEEIFAVMICGKDVKRMRTAQHKRLRDAAERATDARMNELTEEQKNAAADVWIQTCARAGMVIPLD